MKRFINRSVAPFLGFGWILLTGPTLRVQVIGSENEELLKKDQVIAAFWHSRIFYMPYRFRWKSKWRILVSPSSDGDIINGILRLFGFSTIRGSSFKQGRSALITLSNKVKNGASAVMIADGSRGPARVAQMGSIYLGKLTGKPIVPMAFGAEKSKVLGSWDKTVIPLPFSRVKMVFGKPLLIDKNIDEKGLEIKRNELEEELNRVTDMADTFP